MIKVKRYKDGITILGHANYAENGKDIVCAAVSTLSQTLIKSIENLTEDKIEYSLKSGEIKLKIWSLSDATKILVDSFFCGVEMISEEYPDYVKIV